MLSLVNLDKAWRFRDEFNSKNVAIKKDIKNNTPGNRGTAIALITGPRYISEESEMVWECNPGDDRVRCLCSL